MPKEIKISYAVLGLLMLFAVFNMPSAKATSEEVEMFTLFIVCLGFAGSFLTLFAVYFCEADPAITTPKVEIKEE